VGRRKLGSCERSREGYEVSKLAEAKQILAERGRTRYGVLEDENGCLCPIGALCVAYTGGSGQDPETDAYGAAYGPTDPEHLADLRALAVTAHARMVDTPPPGHWNPASTNYSWIYRYNDESLELNHTDDEVLSLFDDAQAAL
jgi:hypothetical protein